MTRFNHARMHRTNSYLMDLVAIDFEIVGTGGLHARENLVLFRSPPGITSLYVRAVKPNRFQPGMTFRNNTPLLGNLALEPMRLRNLDAKGGVAVCDVGANDRQLTRRRMVGHRVKSN